MNERVLKILGKQKVSLVMADVGASGDSWRDFERLKSIADLLRFDPDQRDIREVNNPGGHRVFTINRAVVDDDSETVDFYLTRFPYCSSTLSPDFAKLKSFAYADWFTIESMKSVPAITLEKAIYQSNFGRIDWIKLDTQGTEFRILNSIPDEIFDQLLVCDIEASLYQHYLQADILPSLHDLMLQHDFWIAEMRPHLNTRISGEASQILGDRYQGQAKKIFEYSKHREVTSLEFCYLRTIEGARKREYSFDQFAGLFACHFSLGIFEYCLEILTEMEKSFGSSELINDLRKETYTSIDERVRRSKIPYYISAVRSRLKSILPHLIWQE